MINKKRLIQLTQKVISINSENPPGNENKLADFIQKYFKDLGLSVKIIEFAKNRPNIIVVLKGSDKKIASKESILLTPHIDTVPIGKGWKKDPMGSQIVKGKLYGRGASDDKGNLAVSMEVVNSLVEDGYQNKKDIILAATADEETGSKQGIIPLLEKGILKPRLALVLDSDEFNSIIAQKGLMHFRIKIFGKKAHGAYNWRGINAIEQAALVINKIKKMKFEYKAHKLLRPPTVNIGVIKGGDKVNIVADYCEFSVDIRFLPGMNHRKILKDINKILISEKCKFKIEIDDLQMPYEIKSGHPFVKSYLDSAKKFGCRSEVKGSEGATVITFFKKHNIFAFATGYGSSGTAHSTDEYVSVNNLYKGAMVLEEYVKKYDKI